ncbi:transcriptional regulator, TetR family [Streptomyces sp. 1222.5]|uniref:TetR/AcrR family transcriptional regulator n=1 Tax=unclassified Streptomyces TaxID=2593676 RepID=UPI00089B8AEC|nr:MULTISPECIES: TetR family transcriptional regulator [unclassified Streptomyces]PKW07853.1 TetR family transcriptional regulator [Streptomyces sp. 5112.2]SEC78194.1 transcriptional regulator, TetR family [Streptomyces sp. 1222.5]
MTGSTETNQAGEQSGARTKQAGKESGARVTGQARRSGATRSAILAAARERFAADGYERATIRAVARDARIDPSMVMRYFGSKEGLFAAAVALDLRLPDLAQVPREDIGRTLVGHFLNLWEENEELTAVLRVGATNEAGAERMQDIFREQLLPVARQACPDPEQVPARAALCAAQLLGLALTRYVLRLPAARVLTREELVAWLGPTVQRYLTAPKP